jgi:hypothetical protein
MADEQASAPDAADAEFQVSDSDRQHWSYQPLRPPPIPDVTHRDWPRNLIDRFVLARLETRGWKRAADVGRPVLLRRVTLDLLGLPPTLAEQRRFAQNTSPDAFEQVVDDLLTRPGYGERWGRHWLDVVRYAETNGYERDAIKPSVWRYRDYVVRALNNDKPYNRFVLEQIAGDELPDATAETMIATGFHRLGPWDDEPADPQQDRFDQLDDLVRTTSRAFLGLTLGCARCHDHKFDAFSIRDYYSMLAIFDPLQRPSNGRQEIDLPAASSARFARVADRDRQIGEFQGQIDETKAKLRAKFLSTGQSRLQAEVLDAFQAATAKRSNRQKELVQKHAAELEQELAAAMPADEKRLLAEHERQIARLRQRVPDLLRGYFLHEPSPAPPNTYLLLRGQATSPGPRVQPAVPAVLVTTQPVFLPPNKKTTRRRLSLARWMVAAENPLTARVIVNRVWTYHFGRGIVATPSDFGVMGSSPTHPELLDWLTHWFVHDADWSLKKLHRLILTSSTYRMSKLSVSEYRGADPENQLMWRFPYRRLEVEAIRDSMLAASGRLNRKMYGPSTYLSVPKDALAGHSDPGKIWKPLNEREASRRTVYAFIKRSLLVPLLEVLDLCDTTRSNAQRNVTTVPTQALTLLNGEFTNRQARHLADRLMREAGENAAARIEQAYLLTLCRKPTATEIETLTMFLNHEAAEIQQEAAAAGANLSGDAARRQALIRLCRVIFNLNEFVYPD